MIGSEVELADIIPPELLENCDIHLCTIINGLPAIDAFKKDMTGWPKHLENVKWNNKLRRKVIISLLEFPTQRGIWLFAGFMNVYPSKNHDGIIAVWRPELKGLVGRLKVEFYRQSVSTQILRGDEYLQHVIVREVLPNPYAGEIFPGYENLHLSFRQLKSLFDESPLDWMTPLSSVKGVYLVTDKKTGKKYVGAAYGDHGIWSRWKSYLKGGHGDNIELKRVIEEEGVGYAFENFAISLLEHHPRKIDDRRMLARESYWKTVLLTRSKFGYNKN